MGEPPPRIPWMEDVSGDGTAGLLSPAMLPRRGQLCACSLSPGGAPIGDADLPACGARRVPSLPTAPRDVPTGDGSVCAESPLPCEPLLPVVPRHAPEETAPCTHRTSLAPTTLQSPTACSPQRCSQEGTASHTHGPQRCSQVRRLHACTEPGWSQIPRAQDTPQQGSSTRTQRDVLVLCWPSTRDLQSLFPTCPSPHANESLPSQAGG